MSPATESRAAGARTTTLRVDWPRCQARGLCAELLPEMVHLDPWGYPLVDPAVVPPAILDHAREAVRSCPRAALRLLEK